MLVSFFLLPLAKMYLCHELRPKRKRSPKVAAISRIIDSLIQPTTQEVSGTFQTPKEIKCCSPATHSPHRGPKAH